MFYSGIILGFLMFDTTVLLWAEHYYSVGGHLFDMVLSSNFEWFV